MTALAFLDCETTGLDPDRHEIWEVGLILRAGDGVETEYVWQLPVDLGRADPIALNIGRFHDRRWPEPEDPWGIVTDDEAEGHAQLMARILDGRERNTVPKAQLMDWATRFVELTRGAHLVGAVVSFDADRLWRLLRRLGQCPMWHYHLVDVEALAAGWLAAGHDPHDGPPVGDKAAPPWSSSELSLAVDVDPVRYDRHTALGDARWAKAIYDAVMGAPDH